MVNRQRYASRRSALLCSTICCLGLALAAWAQEPQTQRVSSAAHEVEQGKFRLHKFEQAIGEENYSIQQDGPSLVVSSKFQFKDRFTSVPLSATLRLKEDLTPEAFDI